MSKATLRKYLDIQANKVFTNVPARIVMDLSEYKNIEEDYAEKVGVEEIDNVYKVPGFFTVEFPEENDQIDFFFPYEIYLNKTENTTINKDILEINFNKEDMLFYGNFKNTDANISMLSSMFQNGAKYLGNKPDKLISALWQQLEMVSNVSIHHLEILVSQLYGDYDKNHKRVVPLRLTGKTYSKKYILNLKESAHNLNNALGFTYGYSKDSLRTSISKKKRGENSFFEDIMGSNYDSLVSKSKKE